jgi:hypothetical protein
MRRRGAVVIGDEVKFGPTNEEFSETVERFVITNLSSTVIPLRPSNAELDAQTVRLDAEAERKALEPEGVTLTDFVAYMPGHSYICTLTREMWPAASVNARIRNPAKDVTASAWLDKNSPVEQMTWAPGEPPLIKDKVVANGGWIKRKGVACFNLYRPPIVLSGDSALAALWIEHIRKIYDGEGDADHIIRYFAFKVQRPEAKINHALMLGGGQGIGKDTICAPLKHAVGPWNFIEISPKHISGRFNGYAKSVFLRVSEARDLGEVNRFDFYEQMKVLTASPPEVLRVDEKHLREYDVFNVCGVIITTNYKTNGIYLPSDDRRHFVAWSPAKKEDFDDVIGIGFGLGMTTAASATSPPICAPSMSPALSPRHRHQRPQHSGKSSTPIMRQRKQNSQMQSTGLANHTGVKTPAPPSMPTVSRCWCRRKPSLST